MSLRAEGVLVKEILSKTRAHTTKLSDVVGELLDGLHLLGQEFRFQEVSQVSIAMLAGNGVQVKKRLVDSLFELKGGFHGLEATGPVLLDGLGNVLKDNATATLVLQLHELLSVLTFLVTGLLEELFKARQSDVISVKVEALVL